MSTEPLVNALDVRKAALRDATIAGLLKPDQLGRFRALLAADDGAVNATITFGRDEENRYLMRVTVTANVTVICQRCLEPMALEVEGDNELAIVWTDEQGAVLPRHLDPLIVEEQSCNLHDVVEDELMLAMRPFNYHDSDECKQSIEAYAGSASDDAAADVRPNPFNVLAQLKAGKKQEP